MFESTSHNSIRSPRIYLCTFECHDNINRWCHENPGHKPLTGWLVTSTLFDKNSVADRLESALLDITPLDGPSYSYFLPHEGTEDEFDKLLNQVIALDI